MSVVRYVVVYGKTATHTIMCLLTPPICYIYIMSSVSVLNGGTRSGPRAGGGGGGRPSARGAGDCGVLERSGLAWYAFVRGVGSADATLPVEPSHAVRENPYGCRVVSVMDDRSADARSAWGPVVSAAAQKPVVMTPASASKVGADRSWKPAESRGSSWPWRAVGNPPASGSSSS